MLSRLGGLGCAMVLLASSALCQEPSAKHAQFHADVYAGYSYLSPNFGADVLGGPGENGGTAGADIHLVRIFDVAAETNWMHVVYGTQENSTALTVLAGPRIFFPPGHARIKLLADALVGVADIHSLIGANSPFTGNTALAVAADGGIEVRAIGPLSLRVEGGFLYSGFQAKYPDTDPQSSIHNQHGRVLIEGVFHF